MMCSASSAIIFKCIAVVCIAFPASLFFFILTFLRNVVWRPNRAVGQACYLFNLSTPQTSRLPTRWHRVAWCEHRGDPTTPKLVQRGQGVMCEIKWGIFLCLVFLFSISTEPPSSVFSSFILSLGYNITLFNQQKLISVFFSTLIPIYKNKAKLPAISSDNNHSTFKPLFSGQSNLKVKNVEVNSYTQKRDRVQKT